MHGGAEQSCGQPGNRNALKHGRYTVEAVARRREVAALLRACRDHWPTCADSTGTAGFVYMRPGWAADAVPKAAGAVMLDRQEWTGKSTVIRPLCGAGRLRKSERSCWGAHCSGSQPSLIIADQVAGDERADNGVDDCKDSKEGNNFEGGSGQHGVSSFAFVRCTKHAAESLTCQILHAVFCIPE